MAVDGQRALAIEDLKGTRERATVRKSQRYERLSWAFNGLQQLLAYTCEPAGVLLEVVDPRNTSQTCPGCTHCSRNNRRSQSDFSRQVCGFQELADHVGAVTMRHNALEARAG
ncbi:MAG TPA: transposase [Armatimonadetes bacterium]|nr:transposase [Armatimonadota bacterium]